MESDKKIASLESEVNIVKGEVKALLIDIREIMNNMDNPFYNTQGTTAGRDTETTVEPQGDAPMRSIQSEDVFVEEPHPDVAEMPVQQEGMQQTGTGAEPNATEMPMQHEVPVQQMGGAPEPYHQGPYYPGFAEAPMQHEVPVQQMGGTPEPDHPGFAETPVQHVSDFAEMFKQGEDGGATQEATPEHAPDFAEMFKQYEEAKQSEEVPEEIPEIQHDNGFDIYTLAELMRWTDYTLETIERGKLDELLNLCVLTGQISETLKDTVSKIADLSIQEVAEGSTPTVQDHIAAMFQLNAVLNPSESDRKAIYSIYGELPWRMVG